MAHRQKSSSSLPWLVTLAGVALYVATVFPGVLMVDAVGLYDHGRTGRYREWHSPPLAAVMGWFSLLVPGPLPITLLGAVPLGIGLFLVLRSLGLPPLAAALGSVAIPLFPPVSTGLFWLSKDGPALGALVLALGVALEGKPSRARLIASLLLLLLPGMVRMDYLPLAAVAAAVAFHRTAPHAWSPGRRMTASVALLPAFVVAGWSVTTLVTFSALKAHREFVVQSVLNHDMAAISLHRSELIAPEYLRRQGWTMDHVRQHYTPVAHDPLTWPPGRSHMVYVPSRDIVPLWLGAVLREPEAYLRHRAALAGHMLAILEEPRVRGANPDYALERTAQLCVTHMPEVPAHLCRFMPGPAVRLWMETVIRLREGAAQLFQPLIYVALCALGLVAGFAWRQPGLALIGGLPLLHLGLLFFLAPAAEWRYLLVTIVCGCVVLLALAARLIASAPMPTLRRAERT